MGDLWSVERVLAAAPDSASAVAGRKLAGPGPWFDEGRDGPVIWGRCRGSAREPYRVVVDTGGPRYQCSCPSPRLPCKHALGLLFRWAEWRLGEDAERTPHGARGRVDASVPVPGARSEPGSRPSGADLPAEPEGKAGNDEAKAGSRVVRAAERDARATTGLVELRQWLVDRVSDGLGRLAARPEEWEEMAARMIDAQLPGVARRLRTLARMRPDTPGWAAAVLGELALLDLLARAFLHREALGDALLATVRSHLGFTVPKAEVLRLPAVADQWAVIGLHDTQDDERIATRRVWLFGRSTRRFAMVLLFSINGAPYEMTVVPGMQIDADVHFYPGRAPLRALIGNRRGERSRVSFAGVGTDVMSRPGGGVPRARDRWAAAIAADPWLTIWPTALRGRITTVVCGASEAGSASAFGLIDPAGQQIAVVGPEAPLWQALSLSGGHTATWFGELRPDGFNPLSLADPAVTQEQLIVL